MEDQKVTVVDSLGATVVGYEETIRPPRSPKKRAAMEDEESVISDSSSATSVSPFDICTSRLLSTTELALEIDTDGFISARIHGLGTSMEMTPPDQLMKKLVEVHPRPPRKPSDTVSSLTNTVLSPGKSAVLIYVPWKIVELYPTHYVGKANHSKVDIYFKDHLLQRRKWDFFIVHNSSTPEPLVLVPTDQFEAFLSIVNLDLAIKLVIPTGAAGDKFRLHFGILGRPLPKFMERVSDKDQLDQTMKLALKFEQDDLSQLGPASLDHYQRWIKDVFASLTPHNKKKKKNEKKIDRQKGYSRMTKRVQRYLGLRERNAPAMPPRTLASSLNVARIVLDPTPHSVRFVCVDVEAYERDQKIVTEIGIAILDTEDTQGNRPGFDGKDWFPLIETHHLRIREYSNIVNNQFIKGCPNSFNFGESEFVCLEDTSKVIGEIIDGGDNIGMRPIIFVGHDLRQDLKYLQQEGYRTWSHPHFLDEIDTKSMYQYMMRSPDASGLENMCINLGYPGHNFHNAGNDAYYTLRAMIVMASRQMAKPRGHLSGPSQDCWSDGDEDDGGEPVKSQPPVEKSSHHGEKERDYGW